MTIDSTLLSLAARCPRRPGRRWKDIRVRCKHCQHLRKFQDNQKGSAGYVAIFASGWRLLACECGHWPFHSSPFSFRQRPARALCSPQVGPRVRVPEHKVAAVGPDPWGVKTTSPPSRRSSREAPTTPAHRRAGKRWPTAATKEPNNARRSEAALGPTWAPTLPALRWARRAREKGPALLALRRLKRLMSTP